MRKAGACSIAEPSRRAAEERQQILADLAARAEPRRPSSQCHQHHCGRGGCRPPICSASCAAQEYIRAGDIYQANLSRPWRARLPDGYPARSAVPAAARAAIPRLSRRSPSSARCVCCPHRPSGLLRIRGGRLDTRPIAGTYPRGKNAAGGSRTGRSAGGASQGAGRAHHAHRPRAQ